MPQPAPYVITTDFSDEEASQVSGRGEVRTQALDTELQNIATTIAAIRTNLAIIQRDDGKLRDLTVESHTLSAEVLALIGSEGFNVRGAWLTATAYAVGDMVKNGTGTYVCLVAHTSGVFATDLAANKWTTIYDSAVYTASGVTFTPTGTVASSNVQAAIAEVASEALQLSAVTAFVQTLLDDASSNAFLTTLTATRAEAGAVAVPVLNKLREIKSITDYGADTAASAASNTAAIQAAITANYGKCLLIPNGTFLVQTGGSTSAPVGDALSITGAITLIFEGIVKGNNNCNVFHINAGSQDVVTFCYEGGGVQGYGTFFELTNRNGSLIKCTAGIPRIYQVKLIDAPQYSIISEGCDDGHVAEVEIIGGQATYPGDNNYGICLVDASLGWKIEGCKTLVNGSGGKPAQAVASITLSAGTADRAAVLNNRFGAQWEKGTYLVGDDCQVNGNWVYNNPNGEGLRVVGKRAQIIANKIRSCLSGGITLYDGEGGQIRNNDISDYEAIGIQVSYAGSSAGKSLNDVTIAHNKIKGKTAGTLLYEAISVRGEAGAATVERRISVIGNEIDTADFATEDRGAVRFLPTHAGTLFQDLQVVGNRVNNCGSWGFVFGAGTFTYPRIDDNKVRDCGMKFVSPGRSGFYFDPSIVMVGQTLRSNEARADDASSKMKYGFEGDTGMESMLIEDNHSRGHVTGGYVNLQHAKNTRRGNRQGDDALQGSFTMAAASSLLITNSNAQSGMRVRIHPVNAAAAALMNGAKMLYFDGTLVAGTSFTVKTADGTAAAGTENFEYDIDV